MRMVRFLILTTILAVVALPLCAAEAPRRADNVGKPDARLELANYFADIQKNAPTALGGLAKNPAAMKDVQARIASMTDQEAAHFQKLMAEMPDWKVAPEAFAAGLPPEMLEQARRVGNEYASRSPKGEKMRDQVGTLVTVLKQLPDTRLKELGIDRQMVKSLEMTFTEMSPLDATLLQKRVGEAAPWDARSAAALNALPPALRRGADALAEHGPLTEKDLAELNAFKTELVGLFDRIDQLPPETRATLKTESLRDKVKQLGQASPDALFMIRHHVPPEMLRSLDGSVSFMERLANLSPEEKKDLEEFRTELSQTFGAIEGQDAETSEKINAMLAQLRPDHLYLLQQRMAPLGEWQAWLPVLYQSLDSTEFRDRVTAVHGPTPDPLAVQDMEVFRTQALQYISSAAADSKVDQKLVQRAQRSIQTAPLERLALIRTIAERMPQGTSAEIMLTIGALHEIDFGCALDLPSPVPDISLDFICNPIEDALEFVEHSVVGIANGIVDAAESAINTLINTMEDTVDALVAGVTNTIDTVVDAIVGVVEDIWDFIQTIPDLAWQAIKDALDLLLDIEIANGVTLRDLVASGVDVALESMKTMLGLAGDWWEAISSFTLPEIPCPPDGFHTPWGDVGDSDAAINFARYKFLVDGIIGLIPDTEISLSIKIPAQVLYMAYDFLGTCLEQASEAADSEELTARHELVLENFENLQIFIGQQIAGIAAQTGDQTTAVFNHITNESTAIQNLINVQSMSIKNLINSESTEIQDGVAAFRKLNLRLAIEAILQDGPGFEVAKLQVPEPAGYLGLVRDIVRMTMDSMTATGQGIGQAQKSYDKAIEFMNAAKYKDAFKEFSKAYREATK